MVNDTEKKIQRYEDLAFQAFKDWFLQIHPDYTITRMQDNCHYDVTVTSPTGKKHTVELKYMPTKDYDNYKEVRLNKSKLYQREFDNQPPADLFWIAYKDNITVTASREEMLNYIEQAENPFVNQVVNKVEADPSQGKTTQTQLRLPHDAEGVFYHLYNGTKKLYE